MQEIIMKFTDRDARVIEFYLRKLYGKDGRSSLSKLCEVAIRAEVAIQAAIELDEVGVMFEKIEEAEARNSLPTLHAPDKACMVDHTVWAILWEHCPSCGIAFVPPRG